MDYCSPDSDSDGDFLPDALEELLGLDPNLFDTDGDGIPDFLDALLGLINGEYFGWGAGGDGSGNGNGNGNGNGSTGNGFGLLDCASTDFEAPGSAPEEELGEGDTGVSDSGQSDTATSSDNSSGGSCVVETIDCNFGERQLITTNGTTSYDATFYNNHANPAISNANYSGKELVFEVDNQSSSMTITVTSPCEDMDMLMFVEADPGSCPSTDDGFYSFYMSSRNDGVGVEPSYQDSITLYSSNAAPHLLILESKSTAENIPFIIKAECN